MKDISKHIYQEGSVFYFDTENYNQEEDSIGIDYEDGDSIKWNWDGKKMMGTIRETEGTPGLFFIKNVKTIE